MQFGGGGGGGGGGGSSTLAGGLSDIDLKGGAPTDMVLQVVTADGYLLHYAMDTKEGGECRLERETVLRETRSEAIGATYLEG
jgi:hypothetical protein